MKLLTGLALGITAAWIIHHHGTAWARWAFSRGDTA